MTSVLPAAHEATQKLTEEQAAGQTPNSTDDTQRTLNGDETSHEAQGADGAAADIEKKAGEGDQVSWDEDPRNAFNFPTSQKTLMMIMVSLAAFTTTLASSIISPAAPFIQAEFEVTETQSLLPLSMYVFALAFGPVVGGPLSETVGRMPVYYTLFPAGALFTLGCGFTHNFGSLCFLRFMAGFCWAPTMTVAVGTIAESFGPKLKGLMIAIFILMPFLGPGLGPVLGAYATTRQSWRWTQWVVEFFAAVTLVLIVFTKETFPANIKRDIAKSRGEPLPPRPPFLKVVQLFIQIALIRPVHMLLTEPIITFICLYVAINVGVLFSLYAAVPFAMETVYHFSVNESGLVFLSVAIGCTIGLVTVIICDMKFYVPQIPNYPPGKVPPEYRLLSAMVGSVGLPLGLFWFAWTAKSDISWASPVVALLPFSWGNLCVFISTAQYATDTYAGSVVASASSANTLARYGFAGAFPLFIIQMLRKLGIDWAVSFFGFLTVALLPIPWLFFKFGPRIRAKSKYETNY